MDPSGDGDEFRRQHSVISNSPNSKTSSASSSASSSSSVSLKKINGDKYKRMPANRAVMYDGIIRDRSVQRSAYSY